MIKTAPCFLAGAAVLAFLAGTVAFSASRALYGERALSGVQVGVVMPQEDRLARLALNLISSLDSVGSLCHFTQVEKEEGLSLLKGGGIAALLEIPPDVVEGILDGSNVPVTVTFAENAGLEAAVFRELTEAGASLLTTSQAAIYAADDALREYGLASEIAQAEEDLNRIYIRLALQREAMFTERTVSAAGDVTVPVFYGISASVLILLLLGIPAAPFLRPPGRALAEQLSRAGVGRTARAFARLLGLTALYLAATAIPMAYLAAKGYLTESVLVWPMWFLLCLTAACWVMMFFALCGNTAAAILTLFAVTSIMLFMSGGIVPSVFLPQAVRAAGEFTVPALFMDAARWMVAGGTAPFAAVSGLAAGLFGIAAAAPGRE